MKFEQSLQNVGRRVTPLCVLVQFLWIRVFGKARDQVNFVDVDGNDILKCRC
jgi:hypothetical protein